mmetsp:Transcript_5877/g.17405  ORF Transcript_5877/g.17405 Transcript_5877/m.17405 type:complete len:275 (+) Transcript_5877:276-1100(+)
MYVPLPSSSWETWQHSYPGSVGSSSLPEIWQQSNPGNMGSSLPETWQQSYPGSMGSSPKLSGNTGMPTPSLKSGESCMPQSSKSHWPYASSEPKSASATHSANGAKLASCCVPLRTSSRVIGRSAFLPTDPSTHPSSLSSTTSRNKHLTRLEIDMSHIKPRTCQNNCTRSAWRGQIAVSNAGPTTLRMTASISRRDSEDGALTRRSVQSKRTSGEKKHRTNNSPMKRTFPKARRFRSACVSSCSPSAAWSRSWAAAAAQGGCSAACSRSFMQLQ